MDRSRRVFSIGLVGIFASACNEVTQNSTVRPKPAAIKAPDVSAVQEKTRTVKPPQCFIGSPDVAKVTVLAASLHCKDSRTWVRENRDKIKTQILAGERGLHLTHLARTANEVPVVVELMKVPEDAYPSVLLGAFSLAAQLDRPLSLGHVRAYLEESEIEIQSGQRTDDLIFSVMATQRAFQENFNLRETPYVTEINA